MLGDESFQSGGGEVVGAGGEVGAGVTRWRCGSCVADMAAGYERVLMDVVVMREPWLFIRTVSCPLPTQDVQKR